MSAKTCSRCRQALPISAFQHRGAGYRSECRRRRTLERNQRRDAEAKFRKLPEQPSPDRAQLVAIINAASIWFGPVDRVRPLVPELGLRVASHSEQPRMAA